MTLRDADGSALQTLSSSVSVSLAPGTYTLEATRISTGVINGVTTGHDYDPRPLAQTFQITGGGTTSASVDYAIAAALSSGRVASTGISDIWSYIAYPLDGTTYAWSISSGTVQSSSLNSYGLKWTAPSSTGSATLTCVTEDPYGISTTFSQAVQIVTPLGDPPSAFYGPGVSADALANLVVGGSSSQKVDILFKAAYSGVVGSLRKTIKWNSSTRTGYSGGTGGSLHFEFFADDATDSHLPTGNRIGYGDLSLPMAAGDLCPAVSLAWHPVLVAGSRYHLVISNSDSDPGTNYLSTNDLATLADLFPAQPTVADADWAVSYMKDGGAWTRKRGLLPSLELNYTSGASQGTGYIGAWSFAPGTISGGQSVREVFTVTGSSRSAQGVMIRLCRVSGSSPLVVTLEDASGTALETVSIAASSVLPAHHWVAVPFSTSHTLALGSTYHLVFASDSSTVYKVFPLQDGSSSEGFTATFTDGYADCNAGSGWLGGWQPYTGTVQTDGDLQFYFY
nr:hypothetical protein [uncultured Holophaga sp.]